MRIHTLAQVLLDNGFDAAVISLEDNLKAFAGVESDNAFLLVSEGRFVLYTDFRYAPAVRKSSPWLEVRDISRMRPFRSFRRVGYETGITHRCFLSLCRLFPGAEMLGIDDETERLRAVKTPEEIEGVAAAAALNDRIWRMAYARFKPGMTEREMARIIKTLMVRYGEGESFETIVCVGANAAECHHIPDDTRWNGRQALLVDMGVKLGSFCSDMTRCVPPAGRSSLYSSVYSLVKKAHDEAIGFLRPGVTGAQLDKKARDIIAEGGFGNAFGHSLGHGVGYKVHESPVASKKSKWVFEPGMIVTVEPGIYLEGNLGVRLEDLVLVTENGNKILSKSPLF